MSSASPRKRRILEGGTALKLLDASSEVFFTSASCAGELSSAVDASSATLLEGELTAVGRPLQIGRRDAVLSYVDFRSAFLTLPLCERSCLWFGRTGAWKLCRRPSVQTIH